MDSTVINVKTDRKIKQQAQKIAAEFGLSLSGIMNAYLRQMVRTKTVHFSLDQDVPSDFFKESMTRSDREFRTGKYKSASTVKNLMKALKKP